MNIHMHIHMYTYIHMYKPVAGGVPSKMTRFRFLWTADVNPQRGVGGIPAFRTYKKLTG